MVTDEDLNSELKRFEIDVDGNFVTLDKDVAISIFKELIERRSEDAPSAETPHDMLMPDLKIRVNAIIEQENAPLVSELVIAQGLGLSSTPNNMRLVRDVLRQLEMKYHGLDLWGE